MHGGWKMQKIIQVLDATPVLLNPPAAKPAPVPDFRPREGTSLLVTIVGEQLSLTFVKGI